MAGAQGDKNSIKTSWIHIEVSAPIIGFIAFPIIMLTFLCLHEFKEDYISLTLLILVCVIILTFIFLAIFKPGNLTIDGRGHLSIQKDLAKKNQGGNVE